MNIIEVRDGFIKFKADDNICLSSFVKVEGIEKSYIAQVIQIKNLPEIKIAFAKILFLYINNGLANYDNTQPSNDAQVCEFPFEEISASIVKPLPIIVGKTQHGDNIVVDSSAFDKKMLISVDDKNANNIYVKNLVKQFNNLGRRVIVIDSYGVIEAKKYKAGVDFKLPLDTNTLAFMYEDCLNDATSDSKSTIVEIFKDLSDYSKTVDFLPFKALKTIVDDMVDKTHLFKLLVLKNKLSKFDSMGYFAADKKEAAALPNILRSKCSIIDVSKLDGVFQTRFIDYIYETVASSNDVQLIFELSNTVSKKSIKHVLDSSLPTAFISHSKFKYLSDVKDIFVNYVIQPSFVNNEVFNIYSTFLKSMSDGTTLIVGEGTNYIPVVSSISVVDEAVTIPREDSISNDNDLEVLISDNDEEIDEIDERDESEDYDDSQIVVENSELINTIDEKSDTAISAITEQIEKPEMHAMFSDEEEESDEEVYIAESDGESSIVEDAQSEQSAEEGYADINQDDSLLYDLEQDSTSANVDNEFADVQNSSVETTSYEDLVEPVGEEENKDDDAEPLELINANDYETVTHEEEIVHYDDLGMEIEELENLDTLPMTDSSSKDNREIEEFVDATLENEIDVNTNANEYEYSQELGMQTDNVVVPVENKDSEFDEIVELDLNEVSDEDIVVNMSDDYDEEPTIDAEEEIVKDLDKVYTTPPNDEFSDSDLDLIDELNNDEDNILGSGSDDSLLEEISDSDSNKILQEESNNDTQDAQYDDSEILETRNSTTPIVPVYEADIPEEDLVVSDPIQQGDTVVHAKYGNGVVEKMIKYGNKTLFAINFDNIGRRLLDPTLTEIKRS